MNPNHKNTLYIILKYSFNENIFQIISAIEKFCFSYISVSLQYSFQFYIIYDNYYTLLFPHKLKDQTYFITSNYTEMHKVIDEALKSFFNSVSDTEEKLDQSVQKDDINPINVILKKILLEINKKNISNITMSPGGFFLELNNSELKNDKIIIINDSEDDFKNINQKYIYLFKQKNIKIDILSLNKKNKNEISKAITFYTQGIFDCLSDNKNNIEQILILEYMPIKFCENLPKLNNNIKFTISYHKAISEQNLMCNKCNKEMKNVKNIYPQKNIENKSDSNINTNSTNTPKENICYYNGKEKKILCFNCYKQMSNQQ
jgi:hypothetical protein